MNHYTHVIVLSVLPQNKLFWISRSNLLARDLSNTVTASVSGLLLSTRRGYFVPFSLGDVCIFFLVG